MLWGVEAGREQNRAEEGANRKRSPLEAASTQSQGGSGTCYTTELGLPEGQGRPFHACQSQAKNAVVAPVRQGLGSPPDTGALGGAATLSTQQLERWPEPTRGLLAPSCSRRAG